MDHHDNELNDETPTAAIDANDNNNKGEEGKGKKTKEAAAAAAAVIVQRVWRGILGRRRRSQETQQQQLAEVEHGQDSSSVIDHSSSSSRAAGPFFSLLPPELILFLLRFLGPITVFSSFSVTCRYLREVVMNDRVGIWSYIYIPASMSLKSSANLIARCPISLRTLYIGSRSGEFQSSHLAECGLRSCKNLEKLSCAYDSLGHTVLQNIGDHGGKLRSLVFLYAYGWKPALPSSFLANVPSLRNIKSFTMRKDGLGDPELAALADNCGAKMEKLDIIGTFSNGGLSYLLEKVCGTLKSLDLGNYKYNARSFGCIERCRNLEALVLHTFLEDWHNSGFISVSRLPNLRKFNLSFGGDDAGDGSVSAKYLFLDGGLKGVTDLSFWGFGGMKNADLEAIASSCPELAYLDISWCSIYPTKHTGLRSILRRCKKLIELDVAGQDLDPEDFLDVAGPLGHLIVTLPEDNEEYLEEYRCTMSASVEKLRRIGSLVPNLKVQGYDGKSVL